MSDDPRVEPTDGFIRAPFKPDEVAALNKFQQAGFVHPFTCIRHNDPDHRDDGTLVATRGGWICPYCGYTQEWAHKMMVLAGIPSIEDVALRYLRALREIATHGDVTVSSGPFGSESPVKGEVLNAAGHLECRRIAQGALALK